MRRLVSIKLLASLSVLVLCWNMLCLWSAAPDVSDAPEVVMETTAVSHSPHVPLTCPRPLPRTPPPLRSPLADRRATVEIGTDMRITVLSKRTIRIEQLAPWKDARGFDDRPTTKIVNRRTAVPSFQVGVSTCSLLSAAGSTSRCLIIKTDVLFAELLCPSNATIERTADGGYVAGWPAPRLLRGDPRRTLQVQIKVGSEWATWWPGKYNGRQLPGTIRTLDNTHGAVDLNCSALPENLQTGSEAAHCEMGAISRDGWAVLDDSRSARLDDGNANGGWPWAMPLDPEGYAAELRSRATDGDVRCAQWAGSGECERNAAFMMGTCKSACERAAAKRVRRAEASSLDWYLIGAGWDYAAGLRDLSELSGASPLPPRYAFGVWFSRWWPWADFEAEALLREFEGHGLPIDVLITDMDWHHTCYRRTYGSEEEKSMDPSGNWPCWSGFTWDPKYFARPTEFLAWCKALGVHNGFNLHFQSGMQQEERAWPAFRDAMGLPPSATFAAFDPLNASYSSHFHRLVLAPLEREGVDFWWLDWQQGEGIFAGSAVPEANPTWWLNYVYATQPDGRRTSPKRRRLIMHRYGGLGNQRYPIGFSGDVAASWESLAFQPHFTASAANVLFSYWSHDVGGFYEPVEGELLVRWVQFGAWSPILRIHGFRRVEIEKRPWHFAPAFFEPIRAALRQRFEMIPHIYTAACTAHDGGPSLVRPLYHDFPEHAAAYEHPGQYSFGAGLIVAPITSRSTFAHPLARGRFWVPPGTWVQAHSGAVFQGPHAFEQEFALDEVPILARAGALVFGQPTPDVEWAHCSRDGMAGGSSWTGRAQRLPACPQVTLWLGDDTWRSAQAARSGVHGAASLYEDDGWSDAYLDVEAQAQLSTHVSWRLESLASTFSSASHILLASPRPRSRLNLTIHPARGCLLEAMATAGHTATEPGQPGLPADEPAPYARRSWRLLLPGLHPPSTLHVHVPPREATPPIHQSHPTHPTEATQPTQPNRAAAASRRQPVQFVGLAEMERRRRAGFRTQPLWGIDPVRLCLVVWVFDVRSDEGVMVEVEWTKDVDAVLPPRPLIALPARGGRVDLHSPSRTSERQPTTPLLTMLRAQAAKILCDQTYPDTVPDDYDRVTWLAGLGVRLAATPSNWTTECDALGGALEQARKQLEALPGRVHNDALRLERIQNATALMMETGPFRL